MKKLYKKADRTARVKLDAAVMARVLPLPRNRVAYAAALEVLG